MSRKATPLEVGRGGGEDGQRHGGSECFCEVLGWVTSLYARSGGVVGAGEGAAAAAAGPLLSATAGRAVSLFQGLIKENQQKIGSSFGTEKFKVSKMDLVKAQ